jgi:hypothetical protein
MCNDVVSRGAAVGLVIMVYGLNHCGNIAKKERIPILFLSNGLRNKKTNTQKEVNPDSMFDGVEETGRCNGGLVVEGCKHIIFPTLIFFKKTRGVHIYMCIFARKNYEVCYINKW